MTSETWKDTGPDEVLDFWFPNDGHWESFERHEAFWLWRMRGRAHQAILERFSELTEAAARGHLDHWTSSPRGRLALVIALDQFPRSVWQGTAAAYGQDIKACRLVLDAFDNGDYDALPNVWEKNFCLIANGHCEGPDHLTRFDKLIELSDALIDEAPEHLRRMYKAASQQPRHGRRVIELFGRHAHRNHDLGRISTTEEEEYIASGKFPHNRSPEEIRKDM